MGHLRSQARTLGKHCKKKEREGKDYKPAKRGDPDRPDPEFKKARQKARQLKVQNIKAVRLN